MSCPKHPLVHGTRRGYLAWHCRCDECVAAYREAARQRYRADRAALDDRYHHRPVTTSRVCSSCDAPFTPTDLDKRTCSACRAHHGQAGVIPPPVMLRRVATRPQAPSKADRMAVTAPASSWWATATPAGFTALAATQAPRMLASDFAWMALTTDGVCA